MHKTTILCQFGLFFVTRLLTHISINSQPFLLGTVSPQWWSPTHFMLMHTNFPQLLLRKTSRHNFWTWMLLHGSSVSPSTTLAFSTVPLQTRLQHLSQPPEPSTILAKPHLSLTMIPCLKPLNQLISSAPQMSPLMGATCLQPPYSLQEHSLRKQRRQH